MSKHNPRPIKRRRASKTIANSLHAKRRAEERYGLNLNQDARREIIKKIQSDGGSLPCERQTNARTLFTVPFRGQTLRVVYDKIRHNLITVLPLEDTHAQA